MPTPQEKTLVRLALTDSQRAEVKRAIGRDGETLELAVEELEERIAPRLASNHNETVLADR
jgi:hypothetical protein